MTMIMLVAANMTTTAAVTATDKKGKASEWTLFCCVKVTNRKNGLCKATGLCIKTPKNGKKWYFIVQYNRGDSCFYIKEL